MTDGERHVAVQGDVHPSQKDNQAVLDRNLAEYDILYNEGRDETIDWKEHFTPGLAFFYAGRVEYELVLKFLKWCGRVIWRLSGETPVDLEEECDKRGVEYNDDIDASIPEIYEMLHPGTRITLIAVIVLTTGGLIGLVVNQMISPVWLAVTLGMPLFYFGAGVQIVGWKSDPRDVVMGRAIDQHAKSSDHTQIFVFCGNRHYDEVADYLKEEGWEADPEESQSWLTAVTTTRATVVWVLCVLLFYFTGIL